jgi:hypothetical protein
MNKKRMIFQYEMCLKIDFLKMLNHGFMFNLKSILICMGLNLQLKDFFWFLQRLPIQASLIIFGIFL